ncbi:transposase family protein [Candidatus Thiosymbion oneisti]|uniref:transposase family protein n=1 Tax=Candidatus Thiosymbion oneisti TaxID=589554 RepID=UPI00105EF049
MSMNLSFSSPMSFVIDHALSKKNPFPKLTSDQKQENRKLAKVRILVEHVIGGMKHFYCLTHRIGN